MFIWDHANINHIAVHAVSTDEAEEVVNSDPLEIEQQIRNGERRFVHLGETVAGRILFVVITIRGDHLRIVTAWPANRQARKFYTEQKDLANDKINGDP